MFQEIAYSGDGFLGQQNGFNIFYDPKISTKVDVYVSGCLDGGTKWEFEVIECPKEKAVLGIHSNVPPSNELLEIVIIDEITRLDSKSSLGHSWISLTKNGQTTFYGLWPDNHPKTTDNGSGTDIRTNLEEGFGTESRFYPLNEQQENRLNDLLVRDVAWSNSYTCAGFAQDAYNRLTLEGVDATEQIIGFGRTYTPRKISESIRELEKQSPTNSYRPANIGEDSSSCSFCF